MNYWVIATGFGREKNVALQKIRPRVEFQWKEFTFECIWCYRQKWDMKTSASETNNKVFSLHWFCSVSSASSNPPLPHTQCVADALEREKTHTTPMIISSFFPPFASINFHSAMLFISAPVRCEKVQMSMLLVWPTIALGTTTTEGFRIGSCRCGGSVVCVAHWTCLLFSSLASTNLFLFCFSFFIFRFA